MRALAAVILSAPLGAEGQQATKAVRLGVIRPAQDNSFFRDLFEACQQVLREAGYVEGRTLTIEYRVRLGSRDEIFAAARELVALKVDTLLAIAPLGVAAAAHATTTIPIVALDLETDPVSSGFVTSLARPGRNVTGVFLDFPELSGKWLQMLAEAIPKAVTRRDALGSRDRADSGESGGSRGTASSPPAPGPGSTRPRRPRSCCASRYQATGWGPARPRVSGLQFILEADRRADEQEPAPHDHALHRLRRGRRPDGVWTALA